MSKVSRVYPKRITRIRAIPYPREADDLAVRLAAESAKDVDPTMRKSRIRVIPYPQEADDLAVRLAAQSS